MEQQSETGFETVRRDQCTHDEAVSAIYKRAMEMCHRINEGEKPKGLLVDVSDDDDTVSIVLCNLNAETQFGIICHLLEQNEELKPAIMNYVLGAVMGDVHTDSLDDSVAHGFHGLPEDDGEDDGEDEDVIDFEGDDIDADDAEGDEEQSEQGA